MYYININCSMDVGLRVSDMPIFHTRFGRRHFYRDLSSFEKREWLQEILFDTSCL